MSGGRAYGQTCERTKQTAKIIAQVSNLADVEDLGSKEAETILDAIDEISEDDSDVFVKAAKNLLVRILADETVNDEERCLLHNLATTLANPISQESIERVRDERFVLTGDFSIDGGKDSAEQMIRAAGGFVSSSVSGKTDYVVVGALGSNAWAFGNFGQKIEKALSKQLTGESRVKIVSEESLVSFFESNAPEAMEYLSSKTRLFDAQWENSRVVSKGFSGLTDGQKGVFDAVRAGQNIYLSGLGGTGKSYILERIIEWARGTGKQVIVCAPTGIAALNIGGSTIHRTLGIGPDKPLQINPYPYIPDSSPLLNCDLMIVDEISMCRLDLFDYLSSVLKKAAAKRREEGKGCCQLVVVGDFCQLPPVITKADRKILEEKYGFDVKGGYPFMGKEWSSWGFEKIELTEAIRQRDSQFVAALNACRVGDLKGVRWIVAHSAKSPNKDAIILCGHNAKANEENAQRLNGLPGKAHTYLGEQSGDVTSQDRPTELRLILKPGARVMALVNQSEMTYMNGTLGTVVECQERGTVVDFDKLGRSFVTNHKWEITRPILVNGKTSVETIGSFEQLPLKLAWAITIHKAQGQTFDSATVYPSCWDYGQLYTALSRLTKVENLYLAHPVNDKFLVTSQDVLDFLKGEDTTRTTPNSSSIDNQREPSGNRINDRSLDGDVSLLEINLPVKCGLNALVNAGIRTVGQLVGLTSNDLLAVQGMGKGKLDNLIDFLASHGLLGESNRLPVEESSYVVWRTRYFMKTVTYDAKRTNA